MHGLHTCSFKYITVAAFCIYAQGGDCAAKSMHAINSQGNYMVDHGIVFLNVCGNPADNTTGSSGPRREKTYLYGLRTTKVQTSLRICII